MKKVLITCMLVLFAIIFNVPAFAGSGSALIPGLIAKHMSSEAFYYCAVKISNITDNELTGTVKLFKEDGTLLTDDNSASTGNIQASLFTTYYEGTANDSYTIDFKLAPRSTGYFQLTMKDVDNVRFDGYGIIEWQNLEGEDTYGLLANGNYFARFENTESERMSAYTIPINMGMPF